MKKLGFFFKEKKTQRGFTLIELLVVISIIGILAGMTMVSYTGAQKQTRDTERRSDLAQYRNSLANFAVGNTGLYPCNSGVDNIIEGAGLCLILTSSDFISSCPTDPLKGTNYYSYVTDGCGAGAPGDPVATEYILFSDLETGGYWLVCSDGRSGELEGDDTPSDSDCGTYL